MSSAPITIINQTSANIGAVEERTGQNGEREIIIKEALNRMESKLAGEAETGAGRVFPRLMQNTNLERTGSF